MDISKLNELMKKKKQDLKQRAKTSKPNPGANRYRLLPGWKAGEEFEFYREFGQHFIKNEKDELLAVYPCLEATHGTECPICVGLQRAARVTTDDTTVELLGKAKAAKSVLLNVLALDSDDPNTPVILEVKRTVFAAIVDAVEEWGADLLVEEGNVIVINREGKGLNTKYSVQVSPKKHVIPKAALARLNNLDEYVKQENDENQRRALGAINNVAGLLSAPSGSGGDKPRTPAPETGFVNTPSPSQSSTGVDLGESLEDMLAGLEEAA